MTDPLVRLMLVPEVAEALAAAENAVGAIQLTARRRSAQYRADAWSAAAAASAGLEGEPASDATVIAAVLLELEQMRGTRQSLLQVVARLHAVLAVELAMEERGRPRADFAESGRLTDLAALVAASKAPALLVASIAHAELLSMSPFDQGNGVIARAISRGIMMESGLDPTGMVLTEVGLRDLGVAAYAAALRRYEEGTTAGISSWVSHCARAVELGVDALRQLITPAR